MRLIEIYSQAHGELYDYLKSDFDVRDIPLYYVAEWLEKKFGTIENMNEELGSEFDYKDFHDLHGDDVDEIYSQYLDEGDRMSLREYYKTQMMNDEPTELPSYEHMSVNKKIPRTTWLIHFSDEARNIMHNGFTYGTDDMTKLGLTTYFYTGRGMKAGQGWNFAFIANSREVIRAINRRKYGKEAVMFMSSGIEVYHYGDEETQIIFQGATVNPKNIVYLHNDGGTWEVMPRNGNRPVYKNDDIYNVIKWVESNYHQYRNVL